MAWFSAANSRHRSRRRRTPGSRASELAVAHCPRRAQTSRPWRRDISRPTSGRNRWVTETCRGVVPSSAATSAAASSSGVGSPPGPWAAARSSSTSTRRRRWGEPAGLPSTCTARVSTTGFAASRPTVSKVGASARQPAVSMLPHVGRRPWTPHIAAGTRVEPAVSVPIPSDASPPATAAADPDDDPPHRNPGLRGLRGGPSSPRSPRREKASWSSAVRPTTSAPAPSSRATAAASATAGSWVSRQRARPNDEVWPATAKQSLTTASTPSRGPRARAERLGEPATMAPRWSCCTLCLSAGCASLRR